MSIFVYLGSLHTVRVQTRRIGISQEALTKEIAERLADFPLQERIEVETDNPTSQVFALAEVPFETIALYHRLLLVDPEIKQQLRFWQTILGRDLSGEAFIFKFSQVVRFREPAFLQRIGKELARGLCVRLEDGQPERLRALVGEVHEVAASELLKQNVMPGVLRTAMCYVQMVATGCWGSLLLPHLPSSHGTSSLSLNWKFLGVPPERIPCMPKHLLVNTHGHALIADQHFFDFLMDVLKNHAATLIASVEQDGNGVEDNIELLQVGHALQVLEELHMSLDPTAFARASKELIGKGDAGVVSTKRQYKVAFLVKVLCYADLLRNAALLHESLQRGMEILLPKMLQPAFTKMLQACSQHLPHAGTISRWRLLLDGAFMLQQRQVNSRTGTGFARYIMADSSIQHGRDFEHIMVASIARDALATCFWNAKALVDCWS